MADYSTYFSLLVKATPEQGNWLCAVHAIAGRTLELFQGDDGDDVAVGEDAALYAEAMDFADEHSEIGRPGVTVGFNAQDGGVWVKSDHGAGNYWYAAALAQALLKRFRLDTVIEFRWTLAGSEPRPDGLDGGAAVITRRMVEHYESVDAARGAAQRARVRLGSDAGAFASGADTEMPRHNLFIEKVVALSTAHLTKTDTEILASGSNGRVLIYPEGWLFRVGWDEDGTDVIDLAQQGFSEAFCELVLLAHREQCKWLHFDCDTDVVPTLPTFFWG